MQSDTGDEPASGVNVSAIAAIRANSGLGPLAAWAVLLLATSGPSFASFQSTVLSPLASTIAARFGGGNGGAWVAQWSLTLPAIGVVVGGPLTGRLIRMFGYRSVAIFSMLLLALAGASGAYIESMTLFLASRLAVGFASGVGYVVLVALSGKLFHGATLDRMISYQNGISALLGMALLLFSGWVAHHYGWRFSFFIYLLVGLFLALALFSWLPPAPPRLARDAPRTQVSLAPLLPAYLLTIATYFMAFMMIVQGSLLMSANGINDPAVQAPVIAAATITYALTASFCSWIEQHVTGGWTFTVALCFWAASMLLLGTMPSFVGALTGSLLSGAGSGLASSYVTTYVIKNSPLGGREQAIGWIAPSHYVGQFSNPFVMQYLRVTIGIQAAFALIGIVLCGAVLVSALMRLRRGARPAKANG